MPPGEVHPFAARGYATVADRYERGRPDYPAAGVDWLAERLALRPGTKVADVGAGTGKLTRALVALGVEVVAVEPLGSMRAVLARVLPGVELLAGRAEALPLPDASVDAVTVGQAAHWFRPDEAAAEVARVLRPQGGVGFIWNMPDREDPLQAALRELVAPRERATAREAWTRWRDGFERGPFTPLEHVEFRHVHELAVDDVVALVASYSFVGGLPADEREDVLRRARELAAAYGDPVRLPYRTDAFACRRRETG